MIAPISLSAAPPHPLLGPQSRHLRHARATGHPPSPPCTAARQPTTPQVADLPDRDAFGEELTRRQEAIDAFPDESGYIQFARFLARRRGRPALASVVHEVLSGVTRRLKDEDKDQRRLARAARGKTYKLKLAIEDGSYLAPVAAKLYVITDGDPTDEAHAWFDLWWRSTASSSCRQDG